MCEDKKGGKNNACDCFRTMSKDFLSFKNVKHDDDNIHYKSHNKVKIEYLLSQIMKQ